MNALADRQIEESIRRFLAADSRVDTGEVDVHVEDRTVFVSGSVDSAAERQAVLDDIRAAVGVQDVVDDLILRNYIERTDEELTEIVRHSLARDSSVGPSSILVQASKGAVTLSGQVESHSLKHAAEDVAWWTPGVTNVVSHLEVGDEIAADLKE